MVVRVRYVLTALLLLVTLGPSAALADPVIPPTGVLAITSGSVGFDHTSDDRILFGAVEGNGFSMLVNFDHTSAKPLFYEHPLRSIDPSFDAVRGANEPIEHARAS